MTAGDVGTAITIDAQGFSLTGSTCTLLANPGPFNAQGQTISLDPVIVNADGFTATLHHDWNGFYGGRRMDSSASGQNAFESGLYFTAGHTLCVPALVKGANRVKHHQSQRYDGKRRCQCSGSALQ